MQLEHFQHDLLLYGKLREQAVCGEFCVLIGCPSGQDGAILLSLKLLSAKVKRLFVISLSLWNQKKRQRE